MFHKHQELRKKKNRSFLNLPHNLKAKKEPKPLPVLEDQDFPVEGEPPVLPDQEEFQVDQLKLKSHSCQTGKKEVSTLLQPLKNKNLNNQKNKKKKKKNYNNKIKELNKMGKFHKINKNKKKPKKNKMRLWNNKNRNNKKTKINKLKMK